MRKYNVAILGTGSWATALGCCASLNKNPTRLWGISSSEVRDINDGFNRHYFGDKPLFAKLSASLQIEKVVKQADVVILAVPSQAIEKVLNLAIDCLQRYHVGALEQIDFVNAAKGFDPKTNDLWSKTIKKHLQRCNFKANLVSLIGPSFAVEVMQKCPTAVNVVSSSVEAAQRIVGILRTEFLLLKIADDENGAQVLSALKNFLAIASGMMYEAFTSNNTQAMILTAGINEIRQFCPIFQFHEKTILDFCGIGDLLLTCSSDKSRNFSFGRKLVQFNSVKISEQDFLVEGYRIYPIIQNLINTHHLKVPLFSLLIDVLSGKIKPQEATKKFIEVLWNQ